MSALPCKADIPRRAQEVPLSARSGHKAPRKSIPVAENRKQVEDR
jgi:hypothetical protein